MINTVITAIVVFIVTNIDDLLIDTVFFAQADDKNKTKAVVLGKYLGIGFITFASCLCAVVLQSVVQKYLSLLGIVPIILGIKIWLDKGNDDKTDTVYSGKSLLVTVALVTISSGGDNFGVYIPLFTVFSTLQFVLTVAVFAVLIALWCILAKRISEFPVFKSILLKYKEIIVPIVLVLLGISILTGAFV
ncbi:MAG: hypothetical protein E7484_03480 [Ruminococcaceae bacterium]|nr:hypothetical protein [Oscillospiraceae bacterium]